MSPSAIVVHVVSTLLFIVALVSGKPLFGVVSLALEVGFAALGRSGRD